MCSNGYDRNRQRWEGDLCYLSRFSFETYKACPMEIVRISNKRIK